MKIVIMYLLLLTSSSAVASPFRDETGQGYFGVTGELYALTWAGKPVLDSLAQCMANAGICWDREVLPWYRVQAKGLRVIRLG